MFLDKYLGKKGAIVIEVVFTFPILVYLVFFILEVVILKELQIALDNIAEECSTQFMFSKDTSFSGITSAGQVIDFEHIIKKYLPGHINRDDITYYFTIFQSPKHLYEVKENIPVYWPASKETDLAKDDGTLVSAGKNKPTNTITLLDYTRPSSGKGGETSHIFLTHKAFVFTVVVRYKFTSGFVRMLFAGGSNTTSGKDFLVWSRSAGFCR